MGEKTGKIPITEFGDNETKVLFLFCQLWLLLVFLFVCFVLCVFFGFFNFCYFFPFHLLQNKGDLDKMVLSSAKVL